VEVCTCDSILKDFKMDDAIKGDGRENRILGTSELKLILTKMLAML
jgi:hypothetical protein